MDDIKLYIVDWLNWGAEYAVQNPQKFFSTCRFIN